MGRSDLIIILGSICRSSYDAYGQLTSQTRGPGDAQSNGQGNPQGANAADTITQQFEYDSWGNATRIVSGLGQTTSATYDNQGRRLTRTDPLGHTAHYSYNSLGERTQSTSAQGRITETLYDNAGRPIEQRQPGQGTGTPTGTRVTYDAAERLHSITSPSGLISTASYDTLSRMAQTTDPAGNVTQYTYGADATPLAGLLTSVTYPTYAESYRYDQRGRQTQVIQTLGTGTPAQPTPATTRTQYQAYDAAGQRISSTDPAGESTLYRYDALGRLVQFTDSLNQTTRQTWDAQDQVTSVSDASGNTHRFTYDKAGRLTKETRPLGAAVQYQYDAAGRLTQRTDAGGNTRTYGWDDAGRLILEEHKLAGNTLDQRTAYQYDNDDQLTAYQQQDGNGQPISSAAYTLDTQGRSTQSAVTYGKVDGGVFSFQLGQGFNADGQLQSQTYPDASQQTIAYDQGRLAQITLPNQSQIGYQAYQWMQPTRIVMPGAVEIRTFDPLQRISSIQVQGQVQGAGNQPLASRQYQYNPTGNITQQSSDLGQTQYAYDKLSRLTQASPDQNLQNLGLPQERYGYDPVGNRTSSAHQPGQWSYNQDNQLVQYPRKEPFSASAPAQTQVSYTPQGHTAQEISTAGNGQPAWQRDYRYDAAERLIETTQNGQTVRYRYDPIGRRISKSSSGTTPTTTRTTHYLYSDTGLMAEADAQGVIIKAYGWNPESAQAGLWSTDPIWQAQVSGNNNSLTDAATRYDYLHTDHLGTPVLATTKDGATSWRGVSEAFGATATTVNAIEMNLRLPGQYWDEETKSHYNYFRDYRPELGRYGESDPIGLLGGMNTFAYVDGRPVMGSDSFGLDPWWLDDSLKRIPDSDRQVKGWLCRFGGPTGSPFMELVQGRNVFRFDVYDDNIAAAERFAEFFDGNYSFYPPHPNGAFNTYQYLLKKWRQRFGGGRGNGARNPEFLWRWGQKGAFWYRWKSGGWEEWKKQNCGCEN